MCLEGVSDESIFDFIEEILSKVEITPKLREIEDDNRSKFGPRSIALPWDERKSSLYDYFAHPDSDTFPGVSADSAGQASLRPVSVANATGYLIASSSSGLPYMQRKGKVLQDAIRDHAGQLGVFPCVLFTRTAEQRKTRNVWGYPISETIEEQRYFRPWLDVEKSLPWRKALIGPDAVDEGVTLLLSGKRGDELVYCVDFEAYDASLSPSLIAMSFNYISNAFQPGARAGLEDIRDRFLRIPIFTPDGELSGIHGVPSGSTFTNTIDSLAQALVSGTTRCQIQGDDGVYVIQSSSRDTFPRRFEYEGLKINREKSEIFETQEAVYLQRYYHPSYRSESGGLGGVYSLFRAANRIKYLEQWTDFEREGIRGDDFFALRTVMILENCKHHPGFVEFVRYAQKLDRNGLAFSQAGLKAYSKSLDSRARAGILHAPNFQSGITDFAVMKVLNA